MTFYKTSKRILDIFLSFILIGLSFPIFIIFSMILWVELKYYPLFVQERGVTITKYRFKILKFRTIKKNNDGSHLRKSDIFLKPSLSDHVTPFAGWLRITGLDELPQLFNILLGQMTFIGPRPLMIQDLKLMEKEYPNYYKKRDNFSSKPGLSGMWQVFGDREKGIQNLIGLEAIYENYKSIYLDLKLMSATFPIVAFAKNSDAILYNRRSLFSRFIIPFYLAQDQNGKTEKFINATISMDIIIDDKTEEIYSIELPSDWWYVIDSYQANKMSNNSSEVDRLSNIEDRKIGNKTA